MTVSNFFTYLFSYIIPQTLEVVNSPINDKITVEKFFGKNRIVVKKYWQSGPYAEKLIKIALKNIKREKEIRKILILGLGGGSMVGVLKNFYPKAEISGVDIDEKMIKLGKKYLGLSNIIMMISDAAEFVEKDKEKERFDLIITDLFVGCDSPASCEAKKFVSGIYSLLNSSGIYIANRSYMLKYRKETDLYVSHVREFFPQVMTINIRPNLLIRAYK